MPKVPRLERQRASASCADFEPGSGCRASKASVAVSEHHRLLGGQLLVVPRTSYSRKSFEGAAFAQHLASADRKIPPAAGGRGRGRSAGTSQETRPPPLRPAEASAPAGGPSKRVPGRPTTRKNSLSPWTRLPTAPKRPALPRLPSISTPATQSLPCVEACASLTCPAPSASSTNVD